MSAYHTHATKHEIDSTCEIRHDIGRTCRDCMYEGKCGKERYKQWVVEQWKRQEEIKIGSVHSEQK